MFKGYFSFSVPTALAKKLFETKNKKENNELIKLIKVRWSNLKHEIENMSGDKTETEKPDRILEIVEETLIFNRKNREQQGLGLKILTPNQMLSRLPITLAQLKAGNNSEKLKMKLDNYYILCTDQKNLQNNYIKVWLTLFRNGTLKIVKQINHIHLNWI